jgi:hypothetical protein
VTNTAQDCNRCIHFFITHDSRFGYGCRALNFKSRRLPWLEVVEASGQPCQFFRKKPHQAS